MNSQAFCPRKPVSPQWPCEPSQYQSYAAAHWNTRPARHQNAWFQCFKYRENKKVGDLLLNFYSQRNDVTFLGLEEEAGVRLSRTGELGFESGQVDAKRCVSEEGHRRVNFIRHVAMDWI